MRAGLPKFKLYDLRHTYATHLLDQLVPITVVSKQLGHKKPTTTLAFYAHWLPQDDTHYIDRLTAARLPTGDFGVIGDLGSKAKNHRICLRKYGEPWWDRTTDPLIKSQSQGQPALYVAA